MARYGQSSKEKAVAQLLPPRRAAVEVVALEMGVAAVTLERWREEARALLEAVITTAAMSETGKSAWCREHGLYPVKLDKWLSSTTAVLAEPEELRTSSQATRQDQLRIKELEHDPLRKDRALTDTAALLVLSKKAPAIFNAGEVA